MTVLQTYLNFKIVMTKQFNENASITNEEINQLPLGAFEGKIVIISDPDKLADAFEEINTMHI